MNQGSWWLKGSPLTPLSPNVTLSLTAQAPFPPSGRSLLSPRPPQPPPLCPSPSPNPGTLDIPPTPFPQSPSPSPCRLGTDSPPCVSAWYVPRYGLRPRSPLPGPPQISGCKLQALSLFLLLGAGSLGCNFLRTGAVGRPSYHSL